MRSACRRRVSSNTLLSSKLPRSRSRKERQALLESLPKRMGQLRQLAEQLGVATLPH